MIDRSAMVEATYDDLADVLYFDAHQEKPQEYLEDADGLIWRLNKQGVRYGVTVLDCQHRWNDRRSLLVSILANALNLSMDEVRAVIVGTVH